MGLQGIGVNMLVEMVIDKGAPNVHEGLSVYYLTQGDVKILDVTKGTPRQVVLNAMSEHCRLLYFSITSAQPLP